jgi:hypothetical protein
MNPKLRRDRNAFLIFLAAVPVALLIALPLAVTNGKIYLAAKAHQQQSGAGGTQPAAAESDEK